MTGPASGSGEESCGLGVEKTTAGVHMNVLAINGSPTHSGQSITELILNQFLKGVHSAGAEAEVIRLAEKRILPCDCGHRFACWVETPGRCIHHEEDDAAHILEAMKRAEMVLFATPLYVESMTAQMKLMLDRTLPLLQPYIDDSNGLSRHPARDLKKGMSFVLLSVCGHYDLSNFDALVHTFERVAWNLNGKLVASILRPHAMLLRRPDRIVEAYQCVMDALRDAGRQLVVEGRVRPATETQIHMELTSRNSFIEEANRAWREAIETGRFC